MRILVEMGRTRCTSCRALSGAMDLQDPRMARRLVASEVALHVRRQCQSLGLRTPDAGEAALG